MTGSKKKIMVVSDSRRREKAKRLKEEIEKRLQDVEVDIYSANPNKLLEELIINKGKEGEQQYDYGMFIIDESADLEFLLSKHLWHNFPSAHLVLWVKGFETPKSTKDIRQSVSFPLQERDDVSAVFTSVQEIPPHIR